MVGGGADRLQVGAVVGTIPLTMPARPPQIVPRAVGVAALAELDRVAWAELAHAYGVGKVGPALHEDVRASLAMLETPGRLLDGVEALASNVFHQGTIYEATGPAVGFMLAFAAGPEVGRAAVRELVALVCAIVIASAWGTEDPGFAGAFGEDIGERTREVVRASVGRLQVLAERVPELSELIEAIERIVLADRITRGMVEEALALLDRLPALDDGPGDEGDASAAEPEWFRHAKFGRARLLRREGDKLCLRFDDGSERVILARFVEPIAGPG